VTRLSLILIIFLTILFLLSPVYLLKPCCYLLTLSDEDSGRLIFSSCLDEGENIVYEWKNSLFGLNVTEIFSVRNGSLVLTEIVCHDPYGNPEPLVDPADVEYLCHEGGPFHAVNLSRAYGEISFMVGKIGKPRITVRDAVIDLEKEVGFGGRVIMKLSRACFFTPDVKLILIDLFPVFLLPIFVLLFNRW